MASPYDQLGELDRMTLSLMSVAVHAGIMNSVADHWPEETQRSWSDKLNNIAKYCDQQVREIHLFAESFDQ
jgi:hypothetical protein